MGRQTKIFHSLSNSFRYRIGPIVLVLGALFLFLYIFRSVSDFGFILETISPRWNLLGASLGILMFTYPLTAGKWTLLYRWMNVSANFVDVFKIIVYYQISGYVPGIVPQFVSLAHYGKNRGLNHRDTFSILLVDEVTKVLTSLAIFAPFLLFHYGNISAGLGALFAAIILLIFLHPLVLRILINAFLRRLGKTLISIEITYSKILAVTLYTAAMKIMTGIGLYLLVIGTGFDVPLLDLIAIVTGAWVIGFLVLIVPNGLGVKEGIITTFLQPYVGLEFAILLAILMRIWSTIPQVIFFVVVLIFDYRLRGKLAK